MTNALIILLAVGLVVVAVAFDKRHKRLRRRIAELDTRAEVARRQTLVQFRWLYERAVTGEGRPPLGFRAEYGEDLFLLALFAGHDSGFFIEAGASDGRELAVTHALEHLGWTGLLVEAVPERIEAAAKYRTGARTVHAALGPPNASPTATLRIYEGQSWDLTSHLTQDGDDTKRPDRGFRDIVVPVRTLDDLLAEDGPPERIDLLVLDIEGAEIDAMRGLDFDARPPRVICIEDHDLDPGTDKVRFLTERGYREVARVVVNRVFIHQSATELLEQANEVLVLDQFRPLGS
ncbi:MAG: FkbM family methyltransferase [Planctomycetota bacterium]